MSKTKIIYKDVAPGASGDASYTSDSAAPFSDLNLSEDRETPPIITGELNEFGLDGSFSAIADHVVPFWSSELSGADCVFANPPSFEIAFDEQYTSMGVSFRFGPTSGNYCRKLNLKWYQQDTLKADVDFYPDNIFYYCEQVVEAYDRIVVTLLETSLPYKYAKVDYVMFGIERTFDMSEIRSAKITNQLNAISAEVPVSTLNWKLDSASNINYIFQLKQQMQVTNDGNLIGVYYINEHSRASRRLYSLKCQDALGVLDGDTFPGGLYNGYSAKQLLEDVVGGYFPIYYEDGVGDKLLTGIITPSTKRRAALQQVVFAWGVCAATDGTDGIRIFTLPDVPEEIGKDRVYTGASVTTTAIVTEVQVTAHTYTEDTTGDVEINGVKYKDNQTVYSVSNPNVTANDKKNIKRVTTASLVSTDIAQEVAQRVYDYYTRRDTAKVKIVWKGELLGDCVTVPNAWSGTNTGNLTKMDITLSNTVSASNEVLS